MAVGVNEEPERVEMSQDGQLRSVGTEPTVLVCMHPNTEGNSRETRKRDMENGVNEWNLREISGSIYDNRCVI